MAGFSFHSILFVPGSRPDRFAKAAQSGADAICIDLEDAVAAADKDDARHAAIAALRELDPSRTAIRINGLKTHHGLADLLALRQSAIRPSWLFMPMVESGHEPLQASGILDDPGVGLVPLIETVAGVDGARDIAGAPSVGALMFGGGDFSAQLGVAMDWEPLLAARSRIVMACAAANIAAIDVPFIKVDDQVGLEAETRRSKALGFAAKALIHPAQVGPVNAVMRPTDAELDEARAAIKAYEAGGRRAIRHNGQMLEAPVVARYYRLIEAQGRV